jgi:hypothetical protein
MPSRGRNMKSSRKKCPLEKEIPVDMNSSQGKAKMP